MAIIEITQLVSRAKAGDSEAFGELYDLFAQRIFRYISLKVQNRQQAEDILQDAFVKAWKGLPRLNDDGLNFSAWLYKISANCINDYFRKKYRAPQVVDLDQALPVASGESILDQAMVEADMATVEAAFGHLSLQYRQILELRFIQGFSVQESAQIMGKNYVSARVLQYRALKKLKYVLQTHYDMGHEKI